MQNYYFLSRLVDRVHLELTNVCVLKCPACSRTGASLAQDKGHLPLETVKKAIHPGTSIRKVTICGNYGDPIYHPTFHQILEYIKSCDIALDLTTNGSHRSNAFWEKTADILTFQDRITFSIDGLEDTNHLYRINSNWEQVMAAVRQMVGRTRVRWKAIVFRHNEHQIEDMKRRAAELGINEIRIQKSSRFRDSRSDTLRPQNPEWLGLRLENQTIIKSFLKNNDRRSLETQVRLRPQCLASSELFVNYAGAVLPCCAAAMYETSPYADWFKELQPLNDLRIHSLPEILSNPRWQDLEALWDTGPAACPPSCIKRCGLATSLNDRFSPEEAVAKPDNDVIKIRLS